MNIFCASDFSLTSLRKITKNMTSRIGRRLAKHNNAVSFDVDEVFDSPSVSSEEAQISSIPRREMSLAQDKVSGGSGSGTMKFKTKMAIIVVLSALAGGVVWIKTKDASPEYAKQYSFIAAGGVVGVMIYLLFIKKIFG